MKAKIFLSVFTIGFSLISLALSGCAIENHGKGGKSKSRRSRLTGQFSVSGGPDFCAKYGLPTHMCENKVHGDGYHPELDRCKSVGEKFFAENDDCQSQFGGWVCVVSTQGCYTPSHRMIDPAITAAIETPKRAVCNEETEFENNTKCENFYIAWECAMKPENGCYVPVKPRPGAGSLGSPRILTAEDCDESQGYFALNHLCENKYGQDGCVTVSNGCRTGR